MPFINNKAEGKNYGFSSHFLNSAAATSDGSVVRLWIFRCAQHAGLGYICHWNTMTNVHAEPRGVEGAAQ